MQCVHVRSTGILTICTSKKRGKTKLGLNRTAGILGGILIRHPQRPNNNFKKNLYKQGLYDDSFYGDSIKVAVPMFMVGMNSEKDQSVRTFIVDIDFFTGSHSCVVDPNRATD